MTFRLNKRLENMGFVINSKVPDEYKKEFEQEVLGVNVPREFLLVWLLLLIDMVLITVDLIELRKLWELVPASKYLFIIHSSLLPIMIPYFFLYYIPDKSDKLYRKKTLHYYAVLATIIWCTIAGIDAQLIHRQISPYIVGIFCIASIVLLKPMESSAAMLSSYYAFIIGIFVLEDDKSYMLGLAINSGIMVILACLISRVYYSACVNDFVSKKVIYEKTSQLESAYKYLEDKVRERTEELNRSNMQLISEISCKYEAELKAAKMELMYKEKERLLKEALEYDKLKTEFFANLSHEFRTPLNIIYCVQQMLTNLVGENELGDKGAKVERYLGIIRQNCYRLLRMIGNLIDITKIDAGFFELNLVNRDIVRVVEDITLSVADYIEEKHIALTFDTELEEKVIACDPDKIERVVLNLLSNAVKFTPENGCIYVNIHGKDGSVIISVRDTGIGIKEEKLNYIFERFIQIDKSLSRCTEGSGIGLSLVKSLIEMHGGTISVYSEYGKGTEFVISLPDRFASEFGIAVSQDIFENDGNVERINIEFSDIYM